MTAPRRFVAVLLVLLAIASLRAAPYVSFDAAPLEAGNDPFARELSFQIELPDGSFRLQPAFYEGDGVWSVRLRPTRTGSYKLKSAYEGARQIEIQARSPVVQEATAAPDRLVRIDPANPLRFVRGGKPFVPFGANLPWSQSPRPAEYYRTVFPAFSSEGLNWARLWMAHWSSMNLDWAPNGQTSPRPGTLDLQVAASWDEIVQAAERAEVVFQLVLQHHGQVSLSVNPNWEQNPWREGAPGGFLKAPQEFFTNARARELTKRKYRYIVARWGYSPAIMAWELFNEVHNAESLRQSPPATADVAAWHAEMAAYLRSIDPENHLVTTSVDPIDSPVYSEMDYRQPHLYSPEMIAASTSVYLHEVPKDRPTFFGEIGDDHLKPTAEERESGDSLIGPVWASVMSDAEQPGQTWYVERLLANGRLNQLGAVARFLTTADFAARPRLEPFRPRTETTATRPYEFVTPLWWQHSAPVRVELPLDGRVAPRAAWVPRALVGAPKSVAAGFPDRTTLAFSLPAAGRAMLHFAGANAGGATVDVRVNGVLAATHTWKADTAALSEPVDLPVELPAGTSELEVRNSGGREWFHFTGLSLPVAGPIVGALGRRNDDAVLLWAWNRLPSALRDRGEAARIFVPEVGAGRWRVRFWDTSAGVAISDDIIAHPGGELVLSTPPVKRHVAAILERIR
ncbi:hypothetical protein [Nibricoccus sp. IMCC34717]|uniref:hypothetical protein n=1 Tax=Nibricoccus sp. IMCC34717 TaxID=3034021 RepID=UPI00384DD58B